MTTSSQLILPDTYEEIQKFVGSSTQLLVEFIVPLAKFEQQIVQVLDETTHSGRILFVYGVSGIGKSTFLQSLRWRRSYLPIRDVIELDASKFQIDDRAGRLQQLYVRLYEIAQDEDQYSDKALRTTVVINFLETLDGEDVSAIRGFFRNVNGLLRRSPLLILWTVNSATDRDQMLDYARAISTTLVSSELPFMHFTGPEQSGFPDIVKKTIRVLNKGRQITDFQLHDTDLNASLDTLRNQPKDQQTIRNYLITIRKIWKERTNYVSSLTETIPKAIEMWVVLCYPEAENQIENFTRRSFEAVEDNGDVDYRRLEEYVKNNQLSADWQGDTLSTALALIKTKILYLPTHAFITSVAAFGPQIDGFPLSLEHMRSWNLPSVWYNPSRVKLLLPRSPLVRQLALMPTKKGKWSGGNKEVEIAIGRAESPYKEISDGIAERRWGDNYFNKALANALSVAYEDAHQSTELPADRPSLQFQAEHIHPHLNVTPDILVYDEDHSKHICIEMYYTQRTQPSVIARYTLSKLRTYWQQIQELQNKGMRPLFP